MILKMPAVSQSNIDLMWIPYTALQITGPDAQAFLQSQLSCDIQKKHSPQIGLYCNRQGRIIANVFVAYDKEADQWLLMLHESILENTLASLKKYGQFSKMTLTVLDKPIAYRRNSVTATVFHYPEFSLYINPKTARADLDHTWHYLQISLKNPQITAQTQYQWLPHHLALHQKPGWVDFKKGCYLGQEIIARMHYKSEIKQTSYAVQILPHLPNLSLADSPFKAIEDNSPIGLVNICQKNKQTYALICAKKSYSFPHTVLTQTNTRLELIRIR